MADRVAAVFVPTIMSLSVLTLIAWGLLGGADGWQRGLTAAVSVLVVACPCAPLKKALIESGVGSSVEMGVTDELLQPFMQIVVKGSEADKKDLFKKVYRETIEKMIHGELDHRSILAQLNHAEFVTREASSCHFMD